MFFRNAEVYLRTLKTKSNVKNISETAKAVLCLDLGATTAGSSIDRVYFMYLFILFKSHSQSLSTETTDILHLLVGTYYIFLFSTSFRRLNSTTLLILLILLNENS